VFTSAGQDVETVQATLAGGQTAPAQWALQLARQVNARAAHARVGVMRDGVVTPIASATFRARPW
jgi:chitin-binding protein